MEFVDIVVQGLAGASELTRVSPGGGLTVFRAQGAAELFGRLIHTLLYPAGVEVDAGLPGASRAALTVTGRDAKRYRLLLDVQTGRRALQQMVDDKPVNLTSVAGEIAQAVTAQLGFPQAELARCLFTFPVQDLPSRRERSGIAAISGATAPPGFGGGPAKAHKPLPPGFGDDAQTDARAEKTLPPGFGDGHDDPGAARPLPPGFDDAGPAAPRLSAFARAGRSDAALAARVQEIETILSATGASRDLEFELDGLQKRLFEVDGRLKPLATLRRSLVQAEEQAARLGPVPNVSPGLLDEGRKLRRARADQQHEVERLEAEKEHLMAAQGPDVASGPRLSVLDLVRKDQLAHGGLIAGVAAVGLALIGAAAFPPLRWIALVDIPAFAVAVAGGFRVINVLEQASSVKRRLQRLDAERAQLEGKLAAEEQRLGRALEAQGVPFDRLPEIETQIAQGREAQALVDHARAALAAAEGEGNASSLDAEHQGLQERVRAVEEQLQGAEGAAADAEQLQAEHHALQRLLNGESDPAELVAVHAEAPPVAAPFAVQDPTPSLAAQPPPAAAARDDHCKQLLGFARDVLLVDVDQVVAQIQARAGQVAAAFSEGRWAGVSFNSKGECSARGADGALQAFTALSDADADAVYVAVKVALLEAVLKRGRVPVVIDRAFDTLPDAKLLLVKRLLGFLAGQTQVVCVSANPALAAGET